MKPHVLIPVLTAFLMVSSAFAGGSGDALKPFATYEQGKSLAVLIDTRSAVFLGTGDASVRTNRERELLAFITSDAHPQAKSIAIEWLGCLGSPACVPALTAAGKEPALTAPVAAAIERIQGPAANQPGAPAISNHAAEVAAFTSALAANPASPGADDRIADKVAHIHIKDVSESLAAIARGGQTGIALSHCAVGEGVNAGNIRECLRHLHSIGYTGHLSIECEGQGGPLLTQSLQWLRATLSDLGIPEEKQ